MDFNTKLLHGKGVSKYVNGSTLPPISQTSAFAYDTPEELEKVFQNKKPGFAYSRIGNPVVSDFEKRINDLEGGIGAVACSSGMSAVTLALLNVLSSGDEVIASSGLFGGSIDLFRDLEAFSIDTKFVKQMTVEELDQVCSDKTKVIYGELIGNPALDVVDVKAVSEYAHSKGILFILDCTTTTPYLAQPIQLGADIVVHSASKYINGGGNSIAGVIVDSGNFPWDFEKYPKLKEYKKYGKFAYLARLRNDIWRNIGACLSPMNAFLCITGMETLGLRMQRICDNAYKLAQAFEKAGIDVNYPLLESSPYHDLAIQQFGQLGGGILSIRLGSKEKAYHWMNQLHYALNVSNIGDTRTLVIHPASTIYLHCTKDQQEAAGVFEDTIRISVGIEDPEDLIQDFISALEQ